MQILLRSCLSLLLLLTSLSANAASEAMTLLEQVGVAAKELNYEGVFVYQIGNKMQSISIIHRADDDGEVERLLSLDGSAREIIRTNDTVTCISPEKKSINVSRRLLGDGFPSDLLSRLSSAQPYYQVKLGKAGRVAGREAQKLIIKPVDKFRYGYRLWIDKETNLLLQSNLIDNKGNVLEKFSFLSINLGIDIPDEAFKPQLSGFEQQWDRRKPESTIVPSDKNIKSPWRIRWLPDGFTLVAQQNKKKARNGAKVEQRVYSDGLSSVSIFIERIRARHSHLKGISKMGGVNAIGTIINAHFVTVVGEVPAQTVEKTGGSIRYVAPK